MPFKIFFRLLICKREERILLVKFRFNQQILIKKRPFDKAHLMHTLLLLKSRVSHVYL